MIFEIPDRLSRHVIFPEGGFYRFRLTVSDGLETRAELEECDFRILQEDRSGGTESFLLDGLEDQWKGRRPNGFFRMHYLFDETDF